MSASEAVEKIDLSTRPVREFLDSQQLAKKFGVTVSRVYSLLYAGELHPMPTKIGGFTVYHNSTTRLESFIVRRLGGVETREPLRPPRKQAKVKKPAKTTKPK